MVCDAQDDVCSPRWPYALAFLLLAPGLAGLTGSSFTFGMREDPLLNGAERASHNELFGIARDIRSDEWGVGLPSVRAQQRSDPSFPLVNLNEGLGQLQRNSADTPVLDWGLAFRPLLWPLLVGNRWSLGVRWFLRESLLFLSLFLLFSVLCARPEAGEEEARRRSSICALSALAVLFSGAFCWWMSTGFTDMAVYASAAVVAVALARRAASRRLRVLYTLAMAYAASCFFFVFYPPSWAPFIWVMGGAAFDLHFREDRSPRRLLVAMVPLVVVIAFAALLGLAYYSPYLALIRHTAYPGRRTAAAGELPLSRILDMILPSHDVLAPLDQPARYLGRIAFMNVCEASVVEVTPLFLLVAMSLVSARVRDALRVVVRRNAGTLVVWLLLGAWMFLPLPDWFGAVTLMRWSPSKRTLFSFGMATAILGASLLCELAAAQPARRIAWREIAFGLLALTAAFLLGRRHLDAAIHVPWTANGPLLVVALSSAVGLVLLHDWRGPTVLAAGWALSLFMVNVKVNPLVRSRHLFYRGEGYAAIEKALAEEPGRVVDYRIHFGNTLAGHELPSLATVQFAPDLGFYRFLTAGAEGVSEDLYNRYAIATFALPPEKTRILNKDEDYIQVAISPCSRRLAALGVNHFVVPATAAVPAECANAFTVAPAGEVVLWSRKEPVCTFGLATGLRAPLSAEDFEFSCKHSGEQPRFHVRRSGFDIEAPAGAGVHYAIAMNTSLVGKSECSNAGLRTLDAHLVLSPTGTGPAHCSVNYFDSVDAIRQLLEMPPRSIAVRSAGTSP